MEIPLNWTWNKNKHTHNQNDTLQKHNSVCVFFFLIELVHSFIINRVSINLTQSNWIDAFSVYVIALEVFVRVFFFLLLMLHSSKIIFFPKSFLTNVFSELCSLNYKEKHYKAYASNELDIAVPRNKNDAFVNGNKSHANIHCSLQLCEMYEKIRVFARFNHALALNLIYQWSNEICRITN